MTVPVVTSSSELLGCQGEQVQIRGSYGVQNLGGYTLKVRGADGRWKRINRVAFVKLEDEHYVVLENRPDDEMETLNGLHVIAAGKLVMPANPPALPVAARPESGPTLVDIISVQPFPAASGE